MVLKCAITDDEPLALSLLENYVSRTPQLELRGKYANAVQAMNGLRENPVDLLFLDIQMPQLDGLELSRIIDPATRVVFTTAFSSYAIDSYKVNALDYLLKPISYPEFLQAVDKALKWFELTRSAEESQQDQGITSADKESIFVRSDRKLVQVRLDDILYIEGLKDYVKICTVSGDRVLSLMSLKSLESVLPAGRFIRVHRSFIAGIKNIREISRTTIVYPGAEIPIGDNYRDAVQNFVSRYSAE